MFSDKSHQLVTRQSTHVFFIHDHFHLSPEFKECCLQWIKCEKGKKICMFSPGSVHISFIGDPDWAPGVCPLTDWTISSDPDYLDYRKNHLKSINEAPGMIELPLTVCV